MSKDAHAQHSNKGGQHQEQHFLKEISDEEMSTCQAYLYSKVKGLTFVRK